MASPYGSYHPPASSFSAVSPTPTPASSGPAAGSASTTVIMAEPAVEKIRRHPHYYLTGGDVHFLVENYLFRVHRYFFERESSYFREKLAIPAVPGQTARGSSDANPFPLEDVQAIDFSRFLWIFYNPKYSIYKAGVDDWSAILKLSWEWKFAEVKGLALRELETFTIDPVQKIDLYQRFEVDRRLLVPSYSALTFRLEPLSIKEGRTLGLETAMLLAEAREYARGKPTPTNVRSPTKSSLEQEVMNNVIVEVFNIDKSPIPVPPEETGDIFGIAPTSPAKQGAALRAPGPITPTASRHGAAKPLVRTGSPVPAANVGAMNSIFQSFSSGPTELVTPAVEKPAEVKPATATAASALGNGDAAAAAGTKPSSEAPATGQAVTSSPPSSSSHDQQLISGSTTQEENHQPHQRSSLPPLVIPVLKVTDPDQQETTLSTAPSPPPAAKPADSQPSGANPRSPPPTPPKEDPIRKRASEEGDGPDDITTTITTPVLHTTPHNTTSHDVADPGARSPAGSKGGDAGSEVKPNESEVKSNGNGAKASETEARGADADKSTVNDEGSAAKANEQQTTTTQEGTSDGKAGEKEADASVTPQDPATPVDDADPASASGTEGGEESGNERKKGTPSTPLDREALKNARKLRKKEKKAADKGQANGGENV
ncbi:hypothetical protein EIP91_007768 [Steccherinum ochraceum]|uniref:BTB domain-containing protein n=1 Tax=Steccherinum ochraceum TaxID=92696 RepID=A0A4R0RLJ3_9APHY|nr:hypothetical protein EIP91_007768 [Steccherinum ochraceum]